MKNWQRDMRDMAVVALLLVVARAAGLLRDMVIAGKFGVGPEADAFNTAMAVINWPVALVVSLATVVFVPRLIRLAEEGKADERGQFASEANSLVAVSAFGVAIALFMLSGPLARFFGGDLAGSTIASASRMVSLFAPASALLLLAGYLGLRLQAIRDNAFTLCEGLPSLTVILVLLAPVALAMESRFALGLLAGVMVQCAALLWLMRRRAEALEPLARRFDAARWREIFAAAGAIAIGQLLFTLTGPIDQFFVARLGDGEVARFGYAGRLIGLIMTLGAVVIGRVLLASFAGTDEETGRARSRRHPLFWTAAFLAGGLAFALAADRIIPPAISVLFERGAFGPQEVRAVSGMASVLAWQLPFFLSGQVLVQWFAARNDYLTLLVAVICGLASKFAALAWGYTMRGENWVLISAVALYIGTFAYMTLRFFATRQTGHADAR